MKIAKRIILSIGVLLLCVITTNAMCGKTIIYVNGGVDKIVQSPDGMVTITCLREDRACYQIVIINDRIVEQISTENVTLDINRELLSESVEEFDDHSVYRFVFSE